MAVDPGKLKEALGHINMAHYEGNVRAFGGFFITSDGKVACSLVCENGDLLAMLGATDLLKSNLMDMINKTKEKM